MARCAGGDQWLEASEFTRESIRPNALAWQGELQLDIPQWQEAPTFRPVAVVAALGAVKEVALYESSIDYDTEVATARRLTALTVHVSLSRRARGQRMRPLTRACEHALM